MTEHKTDNEDKVVKEQKVVKEHKADKEHRLDRKLIKDGAPFAVLSYVFLLWILTFIFKKDNAFARFHAKQGIVIFVGNLICFVFGLIPVIGAIFHLLGFVLILTSLYGVYLSLTGKCEKIYLVGDIADKLTV